MVTNEAYLPKPRANSASFRLPSNILDQIREVYESRNIAPNTLVNQIIEAHLDWHSLAPHAMLCYMPDSFLVRLMDGLTEEELSGIARETAMKDLVDISMFLRAKFGISSISNIAEPG